MFCVILDMLCDLEQWIMLVCVLISDIRFIIRIRIRNFGYPKVGYPKFRIRIRIVKSTIRNVRISEISDIRF
ncbi:hypothetical protein Hanom_Chr14g01315341 [Helianthus anomalus]